MMPPLLPRLAPTVIRRPRLDEWFTRFKSVPIRCVVGPAGFGKTTAIMSYLQHAEKNGLYFSIPSNADALGVYAAIADGIHRSTLRERPELTADAVLAGLIAEAPVTIAIDDADQASPEGIAAIVDLIERAPEGISLLVSARSRTAINVSNYVSRGLATMCDAERLAFDATEIRHVAETCDVTFSHTDVMRLLQATDGWPMAASNAIRKAAEDGRNLAGAFEHWRARQGHLFEEFIEAALEHAKPEEAELVHQLLDGVLCEDQDILRDLEAAGLFVIHTAGGPQPLRALSRSRATRLAGMVPQTVSPMQVRLLGRFHAEIDGRPIEWVRRRDAQIFKYVVLKRSGTATRSELADVFWPGAEKHLISQNLRTAFSNIRKAIGNIVGLDAVDAYVTATGEIAIASNNVVIDVHRFVAHANDGDQQLDRGELRAALAHYRTAENVYSGGLLVGDAAEPWFAARAEELAERHVIVLQRQAEILLAISDHGRAAAYARRVLELYPENEPMQSLLAEATRLSTERRVSYGRRNTDLLGSNPSIPATA